MNKKVNVSIIMPAYNAEHYISESIDSVLEQSYTDWELIVVNDCSTDSTSKILKEYGAGDERIKAVNLENNMGAPAGPRNIGVKLAKGQWIAFLDADDIWHKDKLKIQLEALQRSGAEFCSTKMVNFITGTPIPLSDIGKENVAEISFRQQLIKFRTPTSSVIVKKDLLIKHPFNESLSYKAREDYDCWLKIHQDIKSSIKINAPLMGYRVIDGQISGNKLVMLKRHFYVLRSFRLKSNRVISIPMASFYTITHFGLAAYHKFFKGGF